MPKKRLNSRLDTLFSSLDQASATSTIESLQPPPGWTWECDVTGQYIACGPEVESVLGISADDFLGKMLQIYGLAAHSVTNLRTALEGEQFPAETTLYYQSRQGLLIPIRMVIFKQFGEDDSFAGWRGFAQVLPSTPGSGANLTDLLQANPPPMPLMAPQVDTLFQSAGVAAGPEGFKPAFKPWTPSGSESLNRKEPISQASSMNQPASIAVPFDIQGKTAGLVEIVDDNGERRWTEDEYQLVQGVANQLGLALENAQLYAAAQQELKERIRAEEEIIRRNSDLATLNQIGQQLNRLASPSEILDLVFNAIGQVMDNNNLFIALYDEASRYISFPVYTLDGQHQVISGHALGNGLIEYVINTQSAILFSNNVTQELRALGIVTYGRQALSMLAVPMLTGENVVGVVVVQNYSKENAFSAIHAELLSTIASQATIALENGRLFQQMQGALITIEVRERYQKNVATAVATLTEFGTQSLPEVLQILAEAAQSSRVYYVQAEQDETGVYWQINNEWRSEGTPSLTASNVYQKLPVSQYPFLANELLVQGKISGLTDIMPSPEDELLKSLNIRSFLAVAVRGKNNLPSFIGFDETTYDRPWGTEEIDALQMAAASLSNTIIREDLLIQLQASLDETTLLFQTSRLMSQAQSEMELYQTSLDACFNGVKSNILSIYFYSNGSSDAYFEQVVHLADQSMTSKEDGTRYAASDFPFTGLLLSGQTVVSNNVALDGRMNSSTKQFFNDGDIASAFLMPLEVRNQIIGVLMTGRTDVQPYVSAEMTFLQTVAAQLTVALDNYRLLRETQHSAAEARQRSEELTLLNRILTTVSSSLDMHNALQTIVDELFNIIPITGASVALLNENKTQVTITADRLRSGESFVGTVIPLADNPSSKKVIETRKTVIAQNAQTSPDTMALHEILRLQKINSLVIIPLLAGNDVFGTVSLDLDKEESDLSSDQLRLAETIVLQAAVTIQNTRLYEMAQEAIVEMRELDRLKSQFLANMSHELRTPLNSIIGFSRVILKGIDGPITEMQQVDLNAIYNSGQHLLRLINDILDLSKIEAGKMELAIDEINLPDLVNSVMSTAAGLVKDKPIKLLHHLPEDCPVVRADPIRIRQVLINLLSNAAKFTEQGTITIEATVQTVKDDKSELLVTVTDTGTGIAPKDQAKLFQPFSQVDDSPTRKTGGTGLGLSICRSLIELHGGRIGLLKSDIDQGSTFFFTLPLQESIEPDMLVLPNELPLEKPVLLMIDDDAQVISLYERYLHPHGLKVVPLTNPTQAVPAAKEIKPFLITLDIMMPNIDGWQVLKSLKDDPDTSRIPVIICSILEEKDKAASLGASDYLVKPFLPDDLVHAVKKLYPAAV